nr:MAG TPA: hypothetical protein [Caudoviricetes sp.]
MGVYCGRRGNCWRSSGSHFCGGSYCFGRSFGYTCGRMNCSFWYVNCGCSISLRCWFSQ